MWPREIQPMANIGQPQPELVVFPYFPGALGCLNSMSIVKS